MSKDHKLYHFHANLYGLPGRCVEGPHYNLELPPSGGNIYGNCTLIRGKVDKKLKGDISGLRGVVTEVYGDCTRIVGNVTDFVGDIKDFPNEKLLSV